MIGCPLPTQSSRACSSGGGGKSDHARQQRQRKAHGSSQSRICRKAIGHGTVRGATITASSSVIFPPPRLGFGEGGCCDQFGLGGAEAGRWPLPLAGEVRLPTVGEGAADQVPVAADGHVRPHHEVGPAQLLLDLLVALLHPIPQTIQPHYLSQVGRLLYSLT